MADAGRNFSLTDELVPLVDEQMKSGRHVSGSEGVREALRHCQDDIRREQGHLDDLRELAQRGDADSTAGL